MERVSREYARSGGRENGPALEGSRAPRAGRLQGERKRAAELSDEPAVRGLARPAVQIRTAGGLTGSIVIPQWWKADANCPGGASGRKCSPQALRWYRACGGVVGR